MKRGILNNLVAALLVTFFAGCGSDVEKVSRTLLGTVVTVTIADSGDVAESFNAAFSEIEKVQKSFSIYDPESGISRLNREGYRHPVAVSEELFSIIDFSIEVSEKTGGAFDITFASMGKLWDFSQDELSLPDDETVKKLLPFVSYKNIILDKKRKSVKFLKSGTRIGLGAVAKGYAVKKAVSALRSRGVQGAIVACAGDIQVIGDNNGRHWKAGIQDPRGKSVIATFLMNDGESVSTSGDYERFRIVNGKRYHHIVDPSTGYPAESGLISVTVFSNDPVVSDAFSTAFFVAGADKTKGILSSMNDVSAVLVDADMTVHVSSNLRGRLQFRDDLKVVFF